MGIQPVGGGFVAGVGSGLGHGGDDQSAPDEFVCVRMGSGRYLIEQNTEAEGENSCGRGCLHWLGRVCRAIRDFFRACGNCFRGHRESFNVDQPNDSQEPSEPSRDSFLNVIEGFGCFVQAGGVMDNFPPRGGDILELMDIARHAGRPSVGSVGVEAQLGGTRERSQSLPAVTSTGGLSSPLVRWRSSSHLNLPNGDGVFSPLSRDRSESLPIGVAGAISRQDSESSLEGLQRAISLSFEPKVRISKPLN